MPYSAEISRANPTALIYLIDQSGSMVRTIDGGQKKCDAASDVVNRMLHALVIKATKGEGVRNYYSVGVVGYGGSGVGSAYTGTLAGRDLVPITDLSTSCEVEMRDKLVSDGAGGLVKVKVRFPFWIKAAAAGGTPMVGALQHAWSLLDSWLREHPRAFPPIVINVTDGASGDGDPGDAAAELMKLQTTDGAVLLLNCHIPDQAAGVKLTFPSDESHLPGDPYARVLFRASSVLPKNAQALARGKGFAVNEQSRGFAYNADLATLVDFLEIGTRQTDANLMND